MNIGAIILAAGQGIRMKSELPKVMHEVAFKPMISYPVEIAIQAKCYPVVVVTGYKREVVENYLSKEYGKEVKFVFQEKQLGTADAVKCGKEALKDVEAVLILYGDVPLLKKETILALIDSFNKNAPLISMIVTEAKNPTGYGRIIRNKDGKIIKVTEDKDCTLEEKEITEVNPGIYVVDREFLFSNLDKIENENTQREFYLTDLIELASKLKDIVWIQEEFSYVQGVNTRAELELANKIMFNRINNRFMKEGVTFIDASTTYISGEVIEIGRDTTIEPLVIIKGKSKIGQNVYIEQGVRIENSTIEDNVHIKAYSVIEGSIIKEGAEIGPMAHLRPGSIVGIKAKIGNFVELKNTVIGEKSKANHLSYLGDGIIGNNVNIGAGTIFCNYDGFGKYQTIIENDAFIGSDSQLVAPVKVGEGAYIATGSTITEDVPPHSLAIARSRQVSKQGYATKLKEKLKKKAGK